MLEYISQGVWILQKVEIQSFKHALRMSFVKKVQVHNSEKQLPSVSIIFPRYLSSRKKQTLFMKKITKLSQLSSKSVLFVGPTNLLWDISSLR